MNYPSFKKALQQYLTAPKPQVYLTSLRKKQKDLAETFLLHHTLLIKQQEASYQRAYLHFIINTHVPIALSRKEATHTVEQWINLYGQILGVRVSSEKRDIIFEKGPTGTEDLDRKTYEIDWEFQHSSSLVQIRELGRTLNYFRYGGDKLIPSSLFDFGLTDSTDFSFEKAIWMADLAELAYHDEAFVEDQLVRWGFDRDSFGWIQDGLSGTQAFLATRESYMVLSFRGTSSLIDGFQDLRLFKTSSTDFPGEIHAGFHSAFQSVSAQTVEEDIRRLAKTKTIYVTGHSLGAALAQLAAFTLAGEPGFRIGGVYLFGSPRVGDRAFADAYNQRLARQTFLHINHKDLVSRIPPAWMGYSQIGLPAHRFVFNIRHALKSQTNGKESSGAPLVVDRKRLEKGFPETANSIRYKSIRPGQLQSVIGNSTAYLSGTRISHTPEGAYSTPDSVEKGVIDEHSINQYFFKLACALVEKKWQDIDLGDSSLS